MSSIMKDEFDEFNFIDYHKLLKSEREERRRAIESIIDEDLIFFFFLNQKKLHTSCI